MHTIIHACIVRDDSFTVKDLFEQAHGSYR